MRKTERGPDIYKGKEPTEGEKRTNKGSELPEEEIISEEDKNEYRELHNTLSALISARLAIKPDNKQAKAIIGELKSREKEIETKLSNNPLDQQISREIAKGTREKLPPAPWAFNEEDKRVLEEINELNQQIQRELMSDVAEADKLIAKRDQLEKRIAPKREALEEHVGEFDQDFSQGN